MEYKIEDIGVDGKPRIGSIRYLGQCREIVSDFDRHSSISGPTGTGSRARFIPLASRDTVSELIRVLNYPKFKLSEDDQQVLLADYLLYVETVRPGRRKRTPRN